MLAWAKRVEAQRAQATALNMLTESRQYDKIKISQKVKDDKTRTLVHLATLLQVCRYCGGSTSQGSAQHMAKHVQSTAK